MFFWPDQWQLSYARGRRPVPDRRYTDIENHALRTPFCMAKAERGHINEYTLRFYIFNNIALLLGCCVFYYVHDFTIK